jgi:hypothetical protein
MQVVAGGGDPGIDAGLMRAVQCPLGLVKPSRGLGSIDLGRAIVSGVGPVVVVVMAALFDECCGHDAGTRMSNRELGIAG